MDYFKDMLSLKIERKYWIVIALGMIMLQALICYNAETLLDVWCNRDDGQIDQLDAGNNRIITLHTKCSLQEISRRIEFKAFDKGVVVSAKQFIYYQDLNDTNHPFVLIYAENKTLIGLINEAEPTRILMMYDFGSGAVWTERMGSTGNLSNLFHRLQKENPQLKAP